MDGDLIYPNKLQINFFLSIKKSDWKNYAKTECSHLNLRPKNRRNWKMPTKQLNYVKTQNS